MAEKQRIDGDTERVVESTNEARQGVELHAMRYVVSIGTIGAMVILAAIWFYYFVN